MSKLKSGTFPSNHPKPNI